MKRNVLVWVEVAIIAALSMAMSFIPDFAWVVFTVVGSNCSCYFFTTSRLDTRFSSRFAMGITPLCSR